MTLAHRDRPLCPVCGQPDATTLGAHAPRNLLCINCFVEWQATLFDLRWASQADAAWKALRP